MKKVYLKEKAEMLERSEASEREFFTEKLISHLPVPLKKYLRVCGYINSPIPVNASIHWAESYLRMSPKKDWGRMYTLQFNSVRPIGRIAYMKFTSMPVAGRDIYRDGYGEMNGKLLGLFKVIYDNSSELAQSALITIFAEFLLVPGYLLSEQVKWEYISDREVRATLTDSGYTVSGSFFFDEEGLLLRFETEDRYYSVAKNRYKKVKFSAVVDSYKKQDNIKIAERVRIMWHLPEGDYEYYWGIVDRIEFNVTCRSIYQE